MDREKETHQTWNKLAKLYEEKFMHLDIYNNTYDRLCEMLPANSTVLEIGCGPGNITKYLLSKRPDLQIEGIDIAPAMIELAVKNNPTAKFTVMDSRNIDGISKKFDAIVCGFCIPYLSEDESAKMIRDCKNLLNDKGVLYLSFVEGEKSKSGFLTGSTGDRTYFYYHELPAVLGALKASHFTQPIIIPVHYSKSDQTSEVHTIIMASKNA